MSKEFSRIKEGFITDYITNGMIQHLKGTLSEVLFYRFLFPEICSKDSRDESTYYIMVNPYTNTDIVYSYTLNAVNWEFISCLLNAYDLLDKDLANFIIHRIIGFTKLYSSFIPLLESDRIVVDHPDRLFETRITLESKGCKHYKISAGIVSIEEFTSNIMLIKNDSRIRFIGETLELLAKTGYRPDGICFYFEKSGTKNIRIKLYDDPALISFNNKQTARSISENVDVAVLKRILIIELKTSEPWNPRNFTPNQRKFLREYVERDDSFREMMKFRILYIPFSNLVDNLKYEIYET